MKNKIEKIQDKIKKLEIDLKKEKQSQKVSCRTCKKTHEIRNLVLVIEQFYIQPSGCTDGDYWTSGDQPEYYLFCPACRAYNRYYHSQMDNNVEYSFLHTNRYSFKEIVYRTDEEDDKFRPMVEAALRGESYGSDYDDGF